DPAALQRHVEILPHEDPPAPQVEGVEAGFQRVFAMKVMRSTIRQLNPHSLSYQETTLAQSPPCMIVSGASTIEEWGSFLKSEETSSSWLTARMPRSDPEAASSKAPLISSAVVVRPSW